MDTRIIVIDDEQDFLDSMRRGLITSGFKNIHLESNPEKAIINSFLEKWIVVLMLGGFGAILLICGVMILLFMK